MAKAQKPEPVVAGAAQGQPTDTTQLGDAADTTAPAAVIEEVAPPVPDAAVAALHQGEQIIAAPGIRRARILVACALGEPNDVIDIDSALAETMKDVIDTDPAAVAYAESLAA